jgi:hypothetical protein
LPSFGQPIAEYPSVCGEPTLFENLKAIIDETTLGLTYEDWLANRLQGACGTARDDHTDLLNDVTNQAEQAANDKHSLVQAFFPDFGADGQFLDDYASSLAQMYQDAKAADALTEPLSAVSVDIPEVPEVCESLVATVRDDIAMKLEELNDDRNCALFVTNAICTGLDENVASIIEEAEAIIDENTIRVDILLNDLIMLEGEDDENVFALGGRLRDEYVSDIGAPLVDSGLRLPTENVPSPCVDISYELLTFTLGVTQDALSFEAFLDERLKNSCGTTADEVADIRDTVEAEAAVAAVAKLECLQEFFGAFGGED